MDEYIKAWTQFLIDEWGLSSDFAPRAAALVCWAAYYGFRPQITSGYRSAEFQAYLVDEWKKGNPNVHTPLPPGKSLHNNTTWYGAPASLALDMVTTIPETVAYLGKQLGVVWAGKNDKVHFALRSGTL